MSARTSVAVLALALGLAACTASQESTPGPTAEQAPAHTPAPPSATPESPATPTPSVRPTLLEPERVVSTGDVADWPGDWSPDSRFYVFFRWSADAPCSGESVYAYDTALAREIQLSSEDYCTRDIDPDTVWDDEGRLLFGDGPDGARWEAITLGDEVVRALLETPPPTCIDRDIPLPPALDGLGTRVVRARWAPDESALALALVSEDNADRFEGIRGNTQDLRLFQRLELAVFPADGTGQDDLSLLGTVFDLGPDSGHEDEDCPGTHLRWSDDGRYLITSLGPFVYDSLTGEALLAPEEPTSGPLNPNLRWSPDDRRVADDRILLDLPSGEQDTLPGILPGFDRGFAGNDRLVYITEEGMVAYDIASTSVRRLTDFRLPLFAVAPNGSQLAYTENGDLWLLRLQE